MLGAYTVPVSETRLLTTKASKGVFSANFIRCAGRMGQRNRKLKNRLFRTSKLESGSIPASICLVAEAWQRLHGVEVQISPIMQQLPKWLKICVRKLCRHTVCTVTYVNIHKGTDMPLQHIDSLTCCV